MALGIVEAVEAQHGIDLLELDHNSPLYLHILIEALRLAFADSESITASRDHFPRLPSRRAATTSHISRAIVLPATAVPAKLKRRPARYYVTDPDVEHVPVKEMLSKVGRHRCAGVLGDGMVS